MLGFRVQMRCLCDDGGSESHFREEFKGEVQCGSFVGGIICVAGTCLLLG